MYINEFDMILGGIILFLSIKGFISGISREVFSFVGFIVGISVATRFNMDVGNFINQEIFPINKKETIELLGFISIFISILIASAVASNIFSMITTPVHFISRLLGYILSITKYVIIFSMIIVGVQHSDFLDKKLKKYYKDSQIILYSHDIGFYVLNMNKKDGIIINNENNTSIVDGMEILEKKTKNIIEN